MKKMIYITAVALILVISAGCEDQTNIVDPQNSEQNTGGSLDKNTILNEEEYIMPFQGMRFIPCINGGAGEQVLVSGTAKFKLVESLDGNGAFHGRISFRALDYGSVGEVTGDIYKGVGGIERKNIYVSPSGFPYSFNFTANYNYHGPNNNYREKVRVNLVINANGELTANVFSLSIDCN